MKTIKHRARSERLSAIFSRLRRLVNVAVLAAALSGVPGLKAGELKTLDYLFASDGEVFVVKKSPPERLKEPLELPHGLTVATNGVIKRAGGEERKLPEKRKLTLDGFWLADDGRLYQFDDHFMFIELNLYRVKEGTLQPVYQALAFADGTRIEKDGTIHTPDGRVLRLQDGQMVTLDGRRFPALDHVMFMDGKVKLLKDGSLLELPPGRTMMMSEGTRVFADGRILFADGRELQLKEGQRITLEGAAMPKVKP